MGWSNMVFVTRGRSYQRIGYQGAELPAHWLPGGGVTTVFVTRGRSYQGIVYQEQ